MDSSDDEKSKGSDVDSPQGVQNQGNHSFSIREEDRPGRVLLRPWLENMLESSTIEGLQWLDKEKTMFKVPWKHRSKKDWSTRHSSVFLEWAKNTGRWNKGDPTPNYAQLKTRLRCAFNKAPDIEEMKGYHSAQGEEPYKVYRFKNRKECLANKLSQGGKNLSKRFFGTSSARSNHQTSQFEIKKERYEDEMMVTGDGDGFYPDGAREAQILSFKDQTGEVKDELKVEHGDITCISLDEREDKFTPSVIPLTVEMFSSSMSDESDTENEGSKRSRGIRGRHGTRSQKHQESPSEPQNGHLVPLKQQLHQKQNDFGINPNATNGIVPATVNTASTNGMAGDMKESASEERGNLDFLTVASLFMEAEKILQNKKDPIAGRESETKQCIKQEIPEHVTLGGETNQHSEANENSNENISNEPEKEKQSTGIVWSLESTSNGNTKSISPAVLASASHSYPPKLPKLVPLSSLRSFPVLNTDSKGNGGSTLLSHLNKIRMVNGNLLHQSMKPQVRLNPSPGTPSMSIGGPAMAAPRPDSATHFQPRLLIFSSSSFLQNFSAPTMAMPRPANPENLRIVLGKFQPPSTSSPSISKDSGVGSQSMPSLIMLSSAAEAAETASSQKVQAIPQASQVASALSGPVPTSIVEVRNEPSVRNNEVTTSNIITTSITTTCVMPMVSTVAKTTPEKENQLDSGAQEEALDLSSATLKQKEPADAMIPDDISDKLEIDEVSTSVCGTVKEDVSSKLNVSDDSAMDINTRLNEATTILREAEELTSDGDPKCSKLLKGVIETLRTCSVELNQWQKSLNSEKDVLHWRTKLLESEEEKIQLKFHYFGISQKKDDQPVGDPKSFGFLTNDSGAMAIKDASKPFLDKAKQFQAPGVAPITSIAASNDRGLDLIKVHNPLVMSRQSAPIGSLHQKVVGMTNFSGGPIKVTVAPSLSQVLPQTLLSAAKSPKPIRVINLSKPPEPCGVVYPMQQDRGKAQQPRPSTPALSLVNGMKLSSTLKNAGPQLDSVGASPSLSPSSSPLVLNIQSPFSHLKVVKINRTPSTDGNLTSATAWCSQTLLSSSTKSKSSETNELKSTDEGHQSRDSNYQDVNQKSRPDETSAETESAAKRFKSSMDETRDSYSMNSSVNDQTTVMYDKFKKRWLS